MRVASSPTVIEFRFSLSLKELSRHVGILERSLRLDNRNLSRRWLLSHLAADSLGTPQAQSPRNRSHRLAHWNSLRALCRCHSLRTDRQYAVGEAIPEKTPGFRRNPSGRGGTPRGVSRRGNFPGKLG